MASSATRRFQRVLCGASNLTTLLVERTSNRLVTRPPHSITATGSFGLRQRLLTYDASLRPVATQMDSASKAEIQLSPPRIKLSRLMEMEDTQMFGVVHGCTQLQLIEDAGTTLTTQYCTRFLTKPDVKVKTFTASLERVDFLKPMLVGDVAEVEAEITYTTARSLQVTASLYAKNEDDGSRYKTVEAKLWFVAKTDGDQPETVPVSPLRNEDGSLVHRPESEAVPEEEIEPHTVDFGRHNFSLPIHPNHCVPGENYCRGGVMLRLMDELGAYVAAAHSYYYAFTSSMDSVLFHRKVDVGTIVVCHAKPIFTTSKMLEVAIRVERHRLMGGARPNSARVADGIFTFMAIDTASGKTREMPQLKLISEEDKKIFESRKKVYEQWKIAKQQQSSIGNSIL